MVKKALGKGLGALLATTPRHHETATTVSVSTEIHGESIQELPIHSIIPSPMQPRKTFSPEELQELTDSIRSLGILQPLIVRKVGEKHELIAGERRWRASQEVGLKTVPAIVRKASNQQVLEWAMVENLQRADLNPMEEAEGFNSLIEQFHLKQEQIAERVGKSRAYIANSLRLRNLAPEVQNFLRQGLLTIGHAKAILGLNTQDEQVLAATQVIKRSLPVRATERLIASMMAGRQKRSKKAKKIIAMDAEWRDLELQLQQALSTRVRIVGTASRGHIEVEFYNPSDLERLLTQFGVHTNGN